MSRPAPLTELPDAVVSHVRGGQVNIVCTIDDAGRPMTTVMSWVVALSSRRLALCVDTRSQAFQNLVARPQIGLEIMGDDLVWGVKGTARVAKERMEATPFPCAVVEVTVEEARDHGAPGTRFVAPAYHYADGKEHRYGLEDLIYAELRRHA